MLRIFSFAQDIPLAIDRSFADRLEYVGVAVKSEGWYCWGSSPVIGSNGKTYLFIARWSASKGHNAWKTDSEIALYVSDNPEGPFVFQEVVLKGGDKEAGNPLTTLPCIKSATNMSCVSSLMWVG